MEGRRRGQASSRNQWRLDNRRVSYRLPPCLLFLNSFGSQDGDFAGLSLSHCSLLSRLGAECADSCAWKDTSVNCWEGARGEEPGLCLCLLGCGCLAICRASQKSSWGAFPRGSCPCRTISWRKRVSSRRITIFFRQMPSRWQGRLLSSHWGDFLGQQVFVLLAFTRHALSFSLSVLEFLRARQLETSLVSKSSSGKQRLGWRRLESRQNRSQGGKASKLFALVRTVGLRFSLLCTA